MSLYVYTIGSAGLLAAAFTGGWDGLGQLFAMGGDPAAWGLLVVVALVQTVGALYAYTAGLRYLEAGVASILATFEPVVAALLAYFVVHEQLEWLQVVGGAMVLLAVLLLTLRSRRGSGPKSRQSAA
jgi:drug/metabolite transporter (DMT)-like permease